VQAAGMDAYADVVLTTAWGATKPKRWKWSKCPTTTAIASSASHTKSRRLRNTTFPGRGDKYSVFKWRAEHFVAFGYDDNDKGSGGKSSDRWTRNSPARCPSEHGNFDYLMGAEVDQYHPDVRKEELEWAKWFIETTNIDGFRLDAVKHISSSFYADFFQKLRSHFKDREIFAVGEYWSGSMDDLRSYIDRTRGMACGCLMCRCITGLCEASKAGREF
jgi:alpha-amylase